MDETVNVGKDPVADENGEQENKPDAIESITEDKKPAILDEPTSIFSNESYANDRQYAIVLALLMEKQYREKVYKWIERLDTLGDCEESREERDMYLKFLILQLSNGKLVTPFTKAPLAGLKPLSTVMPRSVYNLIYKGKYITGECHPPKDIRHKVYCPPDNIEPALFFGRQPIPRKGGFVYTAAFSTK